MIRGMKLKRILRWAVTSLAPVALLIQAVPYGRDHANPPVATEPSWDSPRTRELAQRACFDCHSNEVRWPWYSHVAPVSWLVQHDVDEGRAAMNVSEWNRPQEEAQEAAQELLDGEMPPWFYCGLHASARLNVMERDALAQGLTATFGAKSGGESGEDGDE
jgi:hypothetical protein